MTERSDKSFDCVAMMRRIRDELSEEIGRLTSFEEKIAWLRSFQHTDPVLQRLQSLAAQQAHAAEDGRKRA